MDTDIASMLESSTTSWCVARRERVTLFASCIIFVCPSEM